MDILGFLNFFGFTPASHPDIVLGVLIIAAVIYLRTSIMTSANSIGVRIDAIESVMDKMKSNIKVIATFLSADRPTFNVGLLEAMSPLQIKPDGMKILEESGFKGVIDSSEENKRKFFDYITEQEPNSKLDVENYSVMAFAALLSESFMKPVQNYLYNFPNNREVFPYLAGVYIRDLYLVAHPEIE